jgi:hypothetical protein
MGERNLALSFFEKMLCCSARGGTPRADLCVPVGLRIFWFGNLHKKATPFTPKICAIFSYKK